MEVTWVALLVAALAAGALAWLSAVAGFGGAVLLLPVFTALFGLRVAVPVLTLTQIASNGGRVWFNRRDINWRLVGWFAIGAVPSALVGGLLLAKAPLGALKRFLGAFLLGVVADRFEGMTVGVVRAFGPHRREAQPRQRLDQGILKLIGEHRDLLRRLIVGTDVDARASPIRKPDHRPLSFRTSPTVRLDPQCRRQRSEVIQHGFQRVCEGTGQRGHSPILPVA